MGGALRRALLRRNPDWNTAVGAAIIIASGIYVVFREERLPATSTRPVLRTQTRYIMGTMPRISALIRMIRRTGRRWRCRGDRGTLKRGPGRPVAGPR